MINNEKQIIDACVEDPSLIFKVINKGYYDVVEKLIEDNQVNVNLEDGVGNDVVTRLLKAKQYDLVEMLMKKRNWNVNHKNSEGNTFSHVLAYDNSLNAVKVVDLLNKKKNFSPNIKNNKGETSFDRALNNNYLCTAIKFLRDKRFNSIDLNTFKNLYMVVFKSREYGKYTKLNTLKIIVSNLEKKDLEPDLMEMIDKIVSNMDVIKRDILNNDSRLLDDLINSYV